MFKSKITANTMRYPAAETAEKHTRILEQASKLFLERGFDGVSLSEIMKSTGLTHGPFYNHFASKEALMAESLGFSSHNALAVLNAAQRSPEEMRAYVADYLSTQHRDDPGKGCMLPALGGEISREPGTRAAVTAHVKGIIGKFAESFPWSAKRNARRNAMRMLCAMVGAQVLARAVDDGELSDELLAVVRSEFT